MACANASGAVTDYWDVDITFAADGNDPNGFVWYEGAVSTTSSTTSTSTTSTTSEPSQHDQHIHDLDHERAQQHDLDHERPHQHDVNHECAQHDLYHG